MHLSKLERVRENRKGKKRGRGQESISPTFYEHNFANFLAPMKSSSFNVSTKKLLYEKSARKMLVKLTPRKCRVREKERKKEREEEREREMEAWKRKKQKDDARKKKAKGGKERLKLRPKHIIKNGI